jgi:hypothetical protein
MYAIKTTDSKNPSYRQVYRITDTSTQATTIGSILLDPNFTIIADHHALATPPIAPDSTISEPTNRFKKRIFDPNDYSDDEDTSTHPDNITFPEWKPFSEPVIARCLGTDDLRQIVKTPEYIIQVNFDTFGTAIRTSDNKVFYKAIIHSPGFATISKTTVFEAYESDNPNPAIQRYTLSKADSKRARVKPDLHYRIASVVVQETGEPAVLDLASCSHK